MVHRSRFDAVNSLAIEVREAFDRDGVIVREDFVPAAECVLLKQRALELVAEHARAASRTAFSSRDNRHHKYAYFEESANRTSVFRRACHSPASCRRLCAGLARRLRKKKGTEWCPFDFLASRSRSGLRRFSLDFPLG